VAERISAATQQAAETQPARRPPPRRLGEFGSFCSTAEDTAWLCALCGYGAEKRLSFAFWCLNPNSADTGGLLLDDWTTPHAPKLRLLAPLLAEASASTSHSASEPPE